MYAHCCKKAMISEHMSCTLTNSSVASKITRYDTQVLLYAFYSRPILSPYRYTIKGFKFLLRNIPKKPIVISGDLNFQETKQEYTSTSYRD